MILKMNAYNHQAILMLENAGIYRRNIHVGMRVSIVLKKDQRSGLRTEGIVQDILSPGHTHTRGIKVRLTDGQVGRVQEIL